MARETTDDYQWVAHYADGTRVPEYVDGVARGWRDVAHARVVALELVPQRDGLPSPLVRIPDDATPVMFRRRTVALDLSGTVTPGDTWTVIGWESADAARYWAFDAAGRSRVADDRTALP